MPVHSSGWKVASSKGLAVLQGVGGQRQSRRRQLNRESNRRQAGGGQHTHTHTASPLTMLALKSRQLLKLRGVTYTVLLKPSVSTQVCEQLLLLVTTSMKPT